MGACQFLPFISAPLNDLRQKATKHEVPGGAMSKHVIPGAGRPFTFPLRRSITLLGNLSVKGNFLKKKDDEQQRMKGHKKTSEEVLRKLGFKYSHISQEVPAPSFLLSLGLNHILHFLHSRL